MTIVAHELKASYAFIERNFFLTRRYWGWELAFLVYSVAGALSISLIGADQGSPASLEDVFMTYTGRSLDDDVDEDETEPDDD